MTTKITAEVISDGAITASSIGNSAITTNKINASAVTTAKIADSAVTTAKIADGAITTAKLASSTTPSLRLDGNSGANFTYTASYQVLNSTHFSQKFQRGNISWNGSTGRVTVTTAGYYNISLMMYQNGATAGRFLIRKDGSTTQLMHVPASVPGVWCVSFLEYIAANSYIDVVADVSILGTFYLGNAHSGFSMHLID